MERKRHASSEVIEQMQRTRRLYAASIGGHIKIVSVLFAEALSHDLIEQARMKGYIVLNDDMELLPPTLHHSLLIS